MARFRRLVAHEEVDPICKPPLRPAPLAGSGVRVSTIMFAGGESVAEPKNDKSQSDKFRDLARELKADEDPAHFEETVRKIAPKGHAEKDRD